MIPVVFDGTSPVKSCPASSYQYKVIFATKARLNHNYWYIGGSFCNIQVKVMDRWIEMALTTAV
jgi:hypothetical protein